MTLTKQKYIYFKNWSICYKYFGVESLLPSWEDEPSWKEMNEPSWEDIHEVVLNVILKIWKKNQLNCWVPGIPNGAGWSHVLSWAIVVPIHLSPSDNTILLRFLMCFGNHAKHGKIVEHDREKRNSCGTWSEDWLLFLHLAPSLILFSNITCLVCLKVKHVFFYVIWLDIVLFLFLCFCCT